MKKIIRLTESDLTRIVKRVMKENEEDKSNEEGEKFRYGPEHAINTLDRNVRKFIKSEDLDKEESFRRLDYLIQIYVKPVLDKVKKTGYWTDKEIESVIKHIRNTYNYDYNSGEELPPPNYIYK